jgi:putative component of membrane protein insertase Oxa1/YidC/SpoIIIJ protein YidD
MKQPALLAIRLYRRYLSPYKGFCCAHRVLAGGESCSVYGYRVIERHGVTVGGALLRRRLSACRHMLERARALSATRPVATQRYAGAGLHARRQAGFCDGCDVPCDVPDVCDSLGDCSSGSGDNKPKRKRERPWWKFWT